MADLEHKTNPLPLTTPTAPEAPTDLRRRRARREPLPQDDVPFNAVARGTPERVERALEHARVAARIADDNRGKDILLLDLRKATSLVDFFVIVTATSRRQSHAIADEIDQEMKRRADYKLGLEGSEEGRWVLIDYGDFVVHVLSPDARTYYGLEEIWGDAAQLDWQDPDRVRPGPSAAESAHGTSLSCVIRHPSHLIRHPMNVLQHLRAAFSAATPEGGDPTAFAAAVRPSSDAKFGDYQANGCMALAKALKKNPRNLAQAVASTVDLAPLADAPEVAGPGFLNVRLREDWLAATVRELLTDDRLGIPEPTHKKTVVVDFSSPNVAKPMHVGHIRSTVIGESLARIIAALGHTVIRDNHLGDWGSQFGMILWGWKNHRDDAAYAADPVAELARLYRLAQDRIKAGESAVEDAARAETARLHAGDPENRALWNQFMPHCLAALNAVYERLGIRFDVELGESFYDPMLADVVAGLEAKGLAVPSEGATVVFTEGSKTPFMVRKSDGAFNYATTDLATIRYRVSTWNPGQMLYVVDHRQSDHFKQLFAVARHWGYDSVDLEHVAFGTILGTDRRPFKTREGDVVGLESLLDDGVAEARKVVDENSPDLTEADRQRVAEAVGLGAIKYADLSQNRLSDYVFDWKKMLAMNGNTGAYLQYAYARIQSIFRKGEIDPAAIRGARPEVILSHPAERGLAVRVLRLPETLDLAASELKPNILTDYLFDLANAFSTFFEECPVLKAESSQRRDSRLALGDLTARTLKFGLNLLGIDVIDRM